MANAIFLLLAVGLSQVLLAHSYQYIGCYIDQGDRDLPERVEKGNVNVGKCNSHCTSRGFLFFGLQDSNECFCGNQYGRYGVAPHSDCKKRCRGNNNEFCGSNWRNSLYASDFGNNGVRSIGCFVDSGNRDLPVLVSQDGLNSVARCSRLCRYRNFLYAGVQHGNECWCGNSYGKYGERSEKECRKRCSGNRSVFCGEGWKNSIYATGVRLVQLPAAYDYLSSQMRAELAAQVRSQQIAFPGGVFCDRCLIAAWNRREAELRSRMFSVHDLDAVMSSYPDKVKEKLGFLRFGANARTTFEDYKMRIGGNYVVRSSYVGIAKRENNIIHMGIINGEVVAYLVPKHHVFERKSCRKILFWTKCNTNTIRERIGYQASEIESIEVAMRSEIFRLFSEKI